jgi:hypothetical protein
VETIFSEIAREIKGSTNKAIGKAISSLGLELGTITNSGLKVDNFKYEIKDYMVLEYLKVQDQYITEVAGETPHSHTLKTPNELKKLSVGHRVLVALVGDEFVVVGRVLNA